MSRKVFASEFVAPGQILLGVDFGHPEIHLEDAADADGTVLMCHPDDLERIQDALSYVSEHQDVEAWLTKIRRREL